MAGEKYAGKILERLEKSGVYTMSGEEAANMLKQAAYDMGLDLNKEIDIDEVRKILGRGTPISQIIREMRER